MCFHHLFISPSADGLGLSHCVAIVANAVLNTGVCICDSEFEFWGYLSIYLSSYLGEELLDDMESV